MLVERDSNIISYLPEFLQNVQELKELCFTEDIQLDILCQHIQNILADTFVLQASEEKIAQWESFLKIAPNGTLDQRKSYILSLMRGSGKLTEAAIQSIVQAINSTGAIVELKDSSIVIKVLPPLPGLDYLYDDIGQALRPRVPAHLGLQIVRYYVDWATIKSNFSGWGAIKEFESWDAVRNYVPNE